MEEKVSVEEKLALLCAVIVQSHIKILYYKALILTNCIQHSEAKILRVNFIIEIRKIREKGWNHCEK